MSISDAEMRRRKSPYHYNGATSTVPRRCKSCGVLVVPVKDGGGRIHDCLACYVRSLTPEQLARMREFEDENDEIEELHRGAGSRGTDPTPAKLAAMVAKFRQQKIEDERQRQPHVDGGAPGVRAYRLHSLRSTKRTTLTLEPIPA